MNDLNPVMTTCGAWYFDLYADDTKERVYNYSVLVLASRNGHLTIRKVYARNDHRFTPIILGKIEQRLSLLNILSETLSKIVRPGRITVLTVTKLRQPKTIKPRG